MSRVVSAMNALFLSALLCGAAFGANALSERDSDWLSMVSDAIFAPGGFVVRMVLSDADRPHWFYAVRMLFCFVIYFGIGYVILRGSLPKRR